MFLDSVRSSSITCMRDWFTPVTANNDGNTPVVADAVKVVKAKGIHVELRTVNPAHTYDICASDRKFP